jgi:thioredoxin-like negative regulator of GroEL
MEPVTEMEVAVQAFYAGDYSGAERCALVLLHEDPQNARVHHLLSRIASFTERGPEALRPAQQAVDLAPENATYRITLGRLYSEEGRLAEAVEQFRAAVEFEPLRGEAHGELGWALATVGRLDEAIPSLERNVELNPDDFMAHLQLSATLHRAGDLPRAWVEYEWRLHADSYLKAIDAPRWTGEDIQGQTLLVWADGGLGDQFQFIRYAALIKERWGARVVVACHPLLRRLMETCANVDGVVSTSEAPPECDRHVFAMSLPGVFGTTLDSIPATVPYLSADSEQVTRWRKILADLDGFRIGVNWEGNRRNAPGLSRAVPLTAFYPVVRTEGVRVFSLQKGAGSEQLAEVPTGLRVYDMGKFFRDFWDTAAMVECLDLVITNDTSVAHMAGALGKPTWILLPRDKCWRWLDDRDDSPWYPSARLFRQGWAESWEDVLLRVETALHAELHARSAARAGLAGATA